MENASKIEKLIQHTNLSVMIPQSDNLKVTFTLK